MTTDDQFLAELQSNANRLHQSTTGADRPPANSWEGILATVTKTNTNEEENDMYALSMNPAALASPVVPGEQRPVSRFLNIAVSVAVIAALVIGGWYANMRLNPPADPTPDSRFAAIATPEESPAASATPTAGDATCDVEPLSVDRVMEIVENPFRFIANGPSGEPSEFEGSSNPYNTELYEAGVWDLLLGPQEGTSQPTDQQFEPASEVADSYLNCLLFGTTGQVWTFYNPVYIQNEVLTEFPVYADEESIQTWVEENIDKAAFDNAANVPWGPVISIYEPHAVSVNPDPALAISQFSTSNQFDQLITFGVSLADSDGKVVYLTSGTGNQLVSRPQESTFNLKLMVAHQTQHDVWYVVPFWHP